MLYVITKKIKEDTTVVYTSDNFREACSALENFAIDAVIQKQGYDSARMVKKHAQMVERGYYIMTKRNLMRVYKKEKNGWIVRGESQLMVEFELICSKKQRPMEKIKPPIKVTDENGISFWYDETINDGHKEWILAAVAESEKMMKRIEERIKEEEKSLRESAAVGESEKMMEKK